MNLCIVNEDHPQCNVPRKSIKACPGRGLSGSFSWALSSLLALSHLESGHATLFLHRISVVRVYLYITATTPDPVGWDPCHHIPHFLAHPYCLKKLNRPHKRRYWVQYNTAKVNLITKIWVQIPFFCLRCHPKKHGKELGK